MSSNYNLSPTEKVNYVQKGKSKGQTGRILKQSLFLFLVLGLIALILLPYFKNKKEKMELVDEINKVQNEINQYEKTNAELKEFLSYLESDQAIEEKARLNLGLQKEGEKVVVIKKLIKENNSDKKDFSQDKKELSNLQKWIKYFFDN